jgi:peptidoglycan biosynthesis protein MviN/MurJ (putative lipid II flippase)
MGWLILPRMAALGALQLQLLLLDRLASGLGTRMVALNQFASNFESVIPGIVGIAIAQSAFSLFSQSAALKQYDKLRDHMKKGILYNLSLAIPGAFALAAMSSVAAWIMHLDQSVAPMFIRALLIYCIAVPFESTNHIMLRSFYALKNTGWPAASSACSCAVAVICGTLLVPSLGVYALAVAYVVAQVCQTLFLGTALTAELRKHGGTTIDTSAALIS